MWSSRACHIRRARVTCRTPSGELRRRGEPCAICSSRLKAANHQLKPWVVFSQKEGAMTSCTAALAAAIDIMIQ